MLVTSPEEHGAVGDGAHDDTSALEAAALAVEMAGGGTILGSPGATYVMRRDVAISSPDVEVDMQGATLTGKGRWLWFGFSISPIGGGAFRRARLRAAGGQPCPRGPRFDWCEAPEITDVDREGVSGTPITLGMCYRPVIRDVRIAGGRDDVGMIGLLLWHCDEALVERVTLDGLGQPFAKGLQVKGGSGNLIQDIITIGSIDGQMVAADCAYYDRGDAPWRAAPDLGPYPYPGGSWLEPDERRATRGTRYVRCTAEGPRRGWVVQESVECSIEQCSTSGPMLCGAVMRRLDGGSERDYHVDGLASECSTALALISADDEPLTATIAGVDGDIYTENAEVSYG